MISDLLASTRVRSRLLLVCALLMIGFWTVQATPYLNVADDSGRYMVLGESLARTGELRLINDIRSPLDTLYPPGFPLIIAFWLRVTGRDPGGVVLPVKATQLLLALAVLPLLAALLDRARLTRRFSDLTLIAYAISPSITGYANEVMSEIPSLFLILVSIVAVERDLRAESTESEAVVPVGRRLVSLLCMSGAYMVRSAGAVVVLAQMVWFRRRFGSRWGAAAIIVGLSVVGIWQLRNRHIVKHAPPGIRYSTYIDQFTLRDPADPKAGRIKLNAIGLLGRARRGMPAYIGMLSRSVLNSMSVNSIWFYVFYSVAVPFTLLMLFGLWETWRRGLQLTVGFYVLFWLFTAMWPWRSERFLVPVAPFTLLFLAVGAETLMIRSVEKAQSALHKGFPLISRNPVPLTLTVFGVLFTAYCLHVQITAAKNEHKRRPVGYALGRTKEEGGFYAACAWLKGNAEPGSVAMGKPPYLLHLYSGCATTQIEPNYNPRVQEKAYMVGQKVRYLVQDAWQFGNKTSGILTPYLHDYGDEWTLAWQDPLGSGVRIWRRKDAVDEKRGS